MKIAIAQLNYHIGNFTENLHKMLNATAFAKKEGADLICFGELAVCGYPPRDFLEFDDFVTQSRRAVEQLALAAEGIAVVVGAPRKNPAPEGKDLFNAAFFLANQKILHIADKSLLPTYDIFDEYRYFEPAKTFQVVDYQGKKIALTICEDIWNIGNENPLYTVCPLDEMASQKPDFILNLSASPFSQQQAQTRIAIVQANVRRYRVPMFYVNHVGAQTELIFDGGSLVASPDGSIFDELPYFEEAVRVYDLARVGESCLHFEQPKNRIRLVHDALLLGIRDYFGKLGLKKAILGLSGGIDSAVTCALAVKALGGENVAGLLMPSQFSSDHSVTDAQILADNLGIKTHIIPIKTVYDSYLDTLHPVFQELPFNIAEENLQARIRGMLLMAMSNKFGYIVLNTSNKSEAAVGYGTLYGDMCGGLSVIGDLYKTEVYELAHFINQQAVLIPINSILKEPSAELRPNQKDSDSLPNYDILDQILYQYIELRKSPSEIVRMGFDEPTVRRTLRLVNINEFKRYQTAPTLRVSSKAFGMGRRMPIVGKYLS